MKRLVLGALIAGSALFATPAFAQSAGVGFSVTGNVEARCSVNANVSESIALGELAQSDGTVDPSLSSNTGGLSRNFTVRCNGTNPNIRMQAFPLVNRNAGDLPAGFTNTVHYTATLATTNSEGGSGSATAQSLVDDGYIDLLVDGRLAGTEGNVELTIGNASTTTTGTILEAGTYSGTILMLISPGA